MAGETPGYELSSALVSLPNNDATAAGGAAVGMDAGLSGQ